MLERAVPKNRGAEFVDLIEDLATTPASKGSPTAPAASFGRSARPRARRRTRSAPRPTRTGPGPQAARAKGPKEAKIASAKPAKEAPPLHSSPPRASTETRSRGRRPRGSPLRCEPVRDRRASPAVPAGPGSRPPDPSSEPPGTWQRSPHRVNITTMKIGHRDHRWGSRGVPFPRPREDQDAGVGRYAGASRRGDVIMVGSIPSDGAGPGVGRLDAGGPRGLGRSAPDPARAPSEKGDRAALLRTARRGRRRQPFVPAAPSVRRGPGQIEALTDFSAARALEDQHAWSDAIALLEKALKPEPDSVAILAAPEPPLLRLGARTSKPSSYSKRVLAADPGDTDTIGRLISYYAHGRTTRRAAEAVLKGVLANPKLEPHSPGRILLAEYELGQALREQAPEPETGGRRVRQGRRRARREGSQPALAPRPARASSAPTRPRTLPGVRPVFLDGQAVRPGRQGLRARARLRPRRPPAPPAPRRDAPEDRTRARRPWPSSSGSSSASRKGSEGYELLAKDPDRPAPRGRDHPAPRRSGPARLQEPAAPVHPGRPLPRDRPGRQGRGPLQGAARGPAHPAGLSAPWPRRS